MALENFLVYRIVSGDDTYPHTGTFGIATAGSLTIDDSDGTGDTILGDFTHTDGADVPDQDVTASNVTGISIGDTLDSRYQYTFTGSDGSSGTIYFVATNGAANYGPLIISDTALDPSVTYTFGTFNTDGAVGYSSLVKCFARGTLIETPDGQVAIENLTEGDLVTTMDAASQPIRWIGSTKLTALELALQPKLRPIRVAKGMLGKNTPVKDLVLSPQHRILVRSAIAKRMFDIDETLIPVCKLTAIEGIDVLDDEVGVEYFHMLFDAHQIVFSEGAATESLYLGREAVKAIGAEAWEEISTLFPEIESESFVPKMARPAPESGRKMKKLAARHAKNLQPVQ